MNDIDALLRAADPLAGSTPRPLADGVARTLTELTMSENRPTRNKRRIAIIAGLAVAVVGVPTAAVALRGGIHTGVFAPKGQTEAHAGEEILNLSDPGILTLVRAEIAKTPVPAGTNLDAVLHRFPVPLDHGVGTTGQARVIVNEVEGSAQCLWYESWLNGDAATRATDLAVIDQIPHWAFTENFASDGGLQALQEETQQMDHGIETLVRQDITANCS